MDDRMNQGERHNLLRLEAGSKKTPLARWLLTQFKGTTSISSCIHLAERFPVVDANIRSPTTGCPASIVEDDGIGEKPWELPESSPLLFSKEESITYGNRQIIGSFQFALASASHQKWTRMKRQRQRTPASALTPVFLQVSFPRPTTVIYRPSIYLSIYPSNPSITSVRSRIHLNCPSEQNPPSSLICFSAKR